MEERRPLGLFQGWAMNSSCGSARSALTVVAGVKVSGLTSISALFALAAQGTHADACAGGELGGPVDADGDVHLGDVERQVGHGAGAELSQFPLRGSRATAYREPVEFSSSLSVRTFMNGTVNTTSEMFIAPCNTRVL
jgi:hypothetical protein